MEIEKIAMRVAGIHAAGVPEFKNIVLGYESMADMLEDLVAAVGSAQEVARQEGQVGPEALKLMAKEHDLLASIVDSVLPEMRELDQQIADAP